MVLFHSQLLVYQRVHAQFCLVNSLVSMKPPTKWDFGIYNLLVFYGLQQCSHVVPMFLFPSHVESPRLQGGPSRQNNGLKSNG